MAAERVAGPQRRLEIDGRARPQIPERRERERLPREVRLERARTRIDRQCGHAAALHADAVALRDAAEIEPLDSYGQARVAAARLEPRDPSDILNDAREHV